MAARYSAEIVEEAGGVRLRPTGDAGVPAELTEVHLLGLAIALAMGSAGYEHHPRPRNPDITIDALLTGDVTMPWQRRTGAAAPASRIVCERSDSSAWRCRLEPRQ